LKFRPHPRKNSRAQAVVDLFGPADFLTIGSPLEDPGGPVAPLLGGLPRDNKARAAAASPISYVGKDAAAFLILHGDKNNSVPVEQSRLLAAALQKAGAEVMLQILPGAGHGGPQFSTPESLALVADFFNRHLHDKK
jgi:dipeptidyl aminopeptidase/acylaminoacyl peptidase